MIRRTPAAVGRLVRGLAPYAYAHAGGARGGGKYGDATVGSAPGEILGAPGGGEGGIGAGEAGPGAPVRETPQSLQNFAPSATSLPHEGHAPNPAPSCPACPRPPIRVAREPRLHLRP